jgi:diketogulonate reductase-like aldo/keto reductase
MLTHEFTLNDGRRIPWLGIGTGSANYGKDVAQTITHAIQAGITHLDGAQMYKNEASLGAGIAASGVLREQLWITTKLNQLPPGQSVLGALRESLEKLGVDHVDLFLIHSPLMHDDLKATWKQMEEAHRQGLARSIGLSNFRIHEMETILEGASITPAVNQVPPSIFIWPKPLLMRIKFEYHPYVAKVADPIVAFCQEKGILVESYGGLTPVSRKRGGPLDPVLDTIRHRLEKDLGAPVTDGQVLLKWINQNGIVSVTYAFLPCRVMSCVDPAAARRQRRSA